MLTNMDTVTKYDVASAAEADGNVIRFVGF